MGWRFKNGIPIWQQIGDVIRQRIVRGELPPGERIPPVRELAMEAGVNPNTMQRALAELERDGLLFSERTSGRYVTENEAVLKRLRRELSSRYVEELFAQLRQLGMTDEEIRELVQRTAEASESTGDT